MALKKNYHQPQTKLINLNLGSEFNSLIESDSVQNTNICYVFMLSVCASLTISLLSCQRSGMTLAHNWKEIKTRKKKI